MKNQPTKITRSVSKGQAPLKKRPITSPLVSTSNTSMKAKERLKTPVTLRNAKTIQQSKQQRTPDEEIPPTIAAGRSRRAVKPNPKYASKDMVTPKNIKSNKNDSNVKQQKGSGTSIEDFFNKDSSDDDYDVGGIDDEQNDTEDDKEYTTIRKRDAPTDSDDSIDSEPSPQRRHRGRPRKPTTAEMALRRTTTTSVPTLLNKSAPITRSGPTQLQQLRKTLNATTVSPLSLNRKRKPETAITTPIALTPKRFHISSTSNLNKNNSDVGSGGGNLNSVTKRSSPSQNVERTKLTKPIAITTTQKELTQDKKLSANLVKPTPTLLNTRALSATKLQQTHKNNSTTISTTTSQTTAKVGIGKIVQPIKPNSTMRLVVSKTKPIVETKKDPVVSNRIEESAKNSTTTNSLDDFESMPTFTIVNINDIINKKGDVLISKTLNAKRSNATATDPKMERRSIDNTKSQSQQHGKNLTAKTSPSERFKPQLRTSTPLLRKPMEKDGNNMLQKVNGRNLPLTPTATTLIEKKPAPRILNSVVGRRTQNVKPVIANLDITPDSPSCSVSIEDDDEDDDDIDASVSSADELMGADRLKNHGNKSLTQTKKVNGTAIINKNKINNEPTTATKENSLAATNYLPQTNQQTLPTKLDSRILSPEKIVVSTQGDKVIKKITCFETWYVINIPEDKPDESERNILIMSLIDVANGIKNLKLPSKAWTSKVTLYELSSATISKNKNHVVYTGDLSEQNIAEEDRSKFQPSCVMFRRAVQDRRKAQLPYDRAVIFKNKTFFTNIEGKNVKLIGAPSTITDLNEVETLLHIVDTLTLQSPFVEPVTTFA